MGEPGMGILDRVSSAFEYSDHWLEFECDECGDTFRIDRADKRVCPECGSRDLRFLEEA